MTRPSTRRARARLLAATVTATLVAAPAASPLAVELLETLDVHVEDADTIVLRFDETHGTRLADLLALAGMALRRPIACDAVIARSRRIFVIGGQRIARTEFRAYLEAVLQAFDLEVVELGPEDDDPLVVRRATHVRPRTACVTRAPVVDAAELDAYRDDPASLIDAVIPLRRASAADVVDAIAREAGGSHIASRVLFDDDRVGVVGFGTDVWALHECLTTFDIDPSSSTWTLYACEHASADEVVAELGTLVDAHVVAGAREEVWIAGLIPDVEDALAHLRHLDLPGARHRAPTPRP